MAINRELQQEIRESIKERTVTATLLEKDRGIFLRVDNSDSVEKIKVVDGEVPDDLLVGKSYEVFLEDRISDRKEHKERYGRFDWVDDDKNPWFNLSYSYGDNFRGRVVDYIGEYGIILEDENGISTKVRAEDFYPLPNVKEHQSIREFIHIGDMLEGVVESIDSEELILKVSISERYNLKQARIKQLVKLRSQHSSKVRFSPIHISKLFDNQSEKIQQQSEYKEILLPPKKGKTFHFSDVRLMIIDDEPDFVSALSNVLHETVAYIDAPYSDLLAKWMVNLFEAKFSNESKESPAFVLQDFSQYLETERFTHILMDWNLTGDQDNMEFVTELRNIIAKAQVPVLYWSNRAKKPEALSNTDFFSSKSNPFEVLMPFFAGDGDKLKGLLNDRKTKEKQFKRQRDQIWRLDFPGSDYFFSQLETFLKNLSQKIGAVGVLWVKRERPGFFSIRGQCGFPESHQDFIKLTNRLEYTPASHVLDEVEKNGGFLLFPKDKANIKDHALPEGTTHLSFFSFSKEHEKTPDRVLICAFSNINTSSKQNELKETFRNQLPLLHRFIFELELLVQMRSLEKLAPLGLAWGSIQHELRQQISNIEGYFNAFSQDSAPDTKMDSSKLQDGIKELRRIVDHQLIFLKDEQKDEPYDMREIIEDCGRNIMHYSKQVKNSKGIDGSVIPIFLDLPEKPLRINFPKAAIIRPLVNLLDNAVYQAKQKEKLGYVIIRLSIDHSDHQTPIHIDVEDTGFGVESEQEKALFHPARSFRDGGGTGMGLYITKTLMKQIGGDVQITENIRWIKSTFTLKYPLST